MSNEYYNHGSVPATGSSLSSATMRAEFDAIAQGMDKLPPLTGNANEVVVVNAGATGQSSVPRAALMDTTIVDAVAKATPVDADLLPLVDSAAANILKKLTWGNVKATLLTWLQGTVLPSPGPIGSTTPSTGAFTTLSASAATNVTTINTTSATGPVGLVRVQRVGVDKGYVGIDGSDNFGLFDNTGTARATVNTTGLTVAGATGSTTTSTVDGTVALRGQAGATVGSAYGIQGVATGASGFQNIAVFAQASGAATNNYSFYGQAGSFYNAAGGSFGGALAVTGTLDISSASSGQIAFPATQNASSNANTLDDYEEGVFTPTIVGDGTAGTTTYTSQAGNYTKVGRVVNFKLLVSWSGQTGTGSLVIGGLPFTAAAESMVTPASVRVSNLTYTAGASITAQVQVSGVTIYPMQQVNGAAVAAIPVDTSAVIEVAGFYHV